MQPTDSDEGTFRTLIFLKKRQSTFSVQSQHFQEKESTFWFFCNLVEEDMF